MMDDINFLAVELRTWGDFYFSSNRKLRELYKWASPFINSKLLPVFSIYDAIEDGNYSWYLTIDRDGGHYRSPRLSFNDLVEFLSKTVVSICLEENLLFPQAFSDDLEKMLQCYLQRYFQQRGVIFGQSGDTTVIWRELDPYIIAAVTPSECLNAQYGVFDPLHMDKRNYVRFLPGPSFDWSGHDGISERIYLTYAILLKKMIGGHYEHQAVPIRIFEDHGDIMFYIGAKRVTRCLWTPDKLWEANELMLKHEDQPFILAWIFKHYMDTFGELPSSPESARAVYYFTSPS